MEKVKNRVGEKHVTKEGYTIEIIEYFKWGDCTIRFEDGTIIKNKVHQAIKNGSIKNPLHKSVLGVGYFGIGKYSYKNHPKIYTTWNSMLFRCHNENYQKRQPTYVGCLVVEEWHNFQNFAKWYEENFKPYMEDWHLDKDILFRGNKTYSPETCCFVPQEINSLFTKRQNDRGKSPIGVTKLGNRFTAKLSVNNKDRGYLGLFKTPEEAFQAYKTEKEKYIKEVVNKWKDQITREVYQALINYQVEITD